MDNEQIAQNETIKKSLTGEEYWKWLYYISEMKKAEMNIKVAGLEAQVLKKDTDLSVMKLQIHQLKNIKNAQLKLDDAKKDYQDFKTQIETRLGISLNNKMVDEFTYEVLDIPENSESKE